MGASDITLHDNVSPKTSDRDNEAPLFQIGQKVKLLEDVKNDGTYPFAPVGALMVRKGAVGYIRSMGDFLQTIRIYEVSLVEMSEDSIVTAIGCREHELEALETMKDEVAEELEWMRKHREAKNKNRGGET